MSRIIKNKVSKADIEGVIKDVAYSRVPDSTMTVCYLRLANGTIVIGTNACIDPKEFNVEFGKQAAYSNAFEKVWELEGYLLKEKLFHLSEPLNWDKPGTPLDTPYQPLGKATPTIIEPTIGRVVWYRPPNTTGSPTPVWPGLICAVMDDRCISVGGINDQGQPFSDTHVPLLQAGDTLSGMMVLRGYCEWMPYQQKQSDKQKAEASVAESVALAMTAPPAPQLFTPTPVTQNQLDRNMSLGLPDA